MPSPTIGRIVPASRALTRLTYVVNARIPTERANGLQIVRMCEACSRLGIETTLVHPARQQRQLSGLDPLEFYGVRSPFAIRSRPVVDVVRFETWMPSAVFPVLFYLHARVWARRAARFALRDARADLYVTRDIPTAVELDASGAPTVLELHDLPRRRSLALLRRLAARGSLRRLVVMTSGLLAALTDNGVVTDGAIVLHDGVDLGRFSPPGPDAATSAVGPVTYTGQLFAEKGIETLVGAARLLGPDVAVLIVGGSAADIRHWRQRVAADGPSNVTIAGYRPPGEIARIQQRAGVLVLPNSGRHPHASTYTSPMKLFEYMAAGRPIVSTDVPAVREILTHDHNAWLVAADDPSAMAAGIQRVCMEPLLAKRLAGQALLDVATHTWDARARALAEAAGFSVPGPSSGATAAC